MKKLLLLLILLVSINGYSQDKNDVIPGNISEVERVIDKYSGKVVDKFDAIVEKVTPLAGQGFDMVVNYKRAQGIVYLLLPIFAFILGIVFYKNYKKALFNQKESDARDWTDADYGAPALISLVLCIICICGSIPAVYHGILYLMAPEWFAVKEIVSLL